MKTEINYDRGTDERDETVEIHFRGVLANSMLFTYEDSFGNTDSIMRVYQSFVGVLGNPRFFRRGEDFPKFMVTNVMNRVNSVSNTSTDQVIIIVGITFGVEEYNEIKSTLKNYKLIVINNDGFVKGLNSVDISSDVIISDTTRSASQLLWEYLYPHFV